MCSDPHGSHTLWNVIFIDGDLKKLITWKGGVQPATRFYLWVALIHCRKYFGTYHLPNNGYKSTPLIIIIIIIIITIINYIIIIITFFSCLCWVFSLLWSKIIVLILFIVIVSSYNGPTFWKSGRWINVYTRVSCGNPTHILWSRDYTGGNVRSLSSNM